MLIIILAVLMMDCSEEPPLCLRKDSSTNYRYKHNVSEDLTLKNAYFDTEVPTEARVKIGGQITFLCRFKQNVGSSGIWFRVDKENPRLDRKLVNTDRIKIRQSSDSLEWILTIKTVDESDAGAYECRLASKPYIKNSYTLHVTGSDMFYAGVCFLNSLISSVYDVVKHSITTY
ncbi:hypothetical protein L9F63_004656 [Diploptera punctata]|uniref:Ig-like domain-containing protein n=1 Tax=Diploptera punctata TaxID=6984 RepID=A0AAD8E746_DIPPU|nr:hypothetical protein L9F63_004656 [Diploptera punctata]